MIREERRIASARAPTHDTHITALENADGRLRAPDGRLLTRRALVARAGLLGTLAAAGSLVHASTSSAAGTGVEIDVADFGTLGTSDDSATFQAALDAVPPGGAQVVAPHGSYNVSNLTVHSGSHVWFPAVTLVNLAGAGTSCLRVPSSASQVVIDGVQIDGGAASAGSAGIIVSGSYCRVTNAFVHDTRGDGITVQAESAAHSTTHVTVDSCRVYGAGAGAITLSSTEAHRGPMNVLVDANHIRGSQDAALGIEGAGERVIFSNNVIENGLPAGKGGAGLRADSHLNSNVLFICNSCFALALEGIHLAGSNVAAVGNTITSSGGTGILLRAREPSQFTADFELSSNVVTGSGDPLAPVSDIHVERAHGGVLTANVLDGAASHGINAVGCDGMSITGNTVKAPGLGSCVRIDACRRVTVAGNVCYRAAQGYGVHVSGPTAEDVTISGNVMSENGSGGVFAGTGVSQIAISGNSIRTDGAGTAIAVSGADSRTAANFTDTPATVPAARRLSVPRDVVLATVTGRATVSGLDPAAAEAGRALYLRFADGCMVTSGPGLVLASNFEAPANSVLSLACDGIKWYETARTVD